MTDTEGQVTFGEFENIDPDTQAHIDGSITWLAACRGAYEAAWIAYSENDPAKIEEVTENMTELLGMLSLNMAIDVITTAVRLVDRDALREEIFEMERRQAGSEPGQ